MNMNPVPQPLASWPERLKHRALGVFNLNDNRWGRDGDKPADGDAKPNAEPESPAPTPAAISSINLEDNCEPGLLISLFINHILPASINNAPFINL